MPCLFAAFAALFPRLAVVIIWIARPELVERSFGGSLIFPVLGVVFLPFATLIYVVLYTPGVGLTSLAWVLVVIAGLFDLGQWSAGYRQRRQLSRL
jgi:hypothetical protein